MIIGDFLEIFMIILGIYLLCMTVLSLAKRKMTEQFCLVWAVMAVLMIVAGILLNPSQIERYISLRGLMLVLIIILGVIWGMWFVSTQVSILLRKNQELAMQTSLLNQDSEYMLKEIKNLKRRLENLETELNTEGESDEESSVCD